ncbi:MAG: autotransporter outer membrane beta-barrel domain-containing protein [Bacteroidales bacterium]|nr:autotransporter outer membrane beta-barrel domain-containing protein [Bacteroidales bacterium]
MTDSQFDQIIREKLLSYECEAPDESVWEGIVAKMAAQRRRKVVLRYVYGAVAAAACVALGLFLFDGSDAPSQLQTAPTVAVADDVVPQELDTPEDVQDIPSIADQIKALRSGNAVAEVLPLEVEKVLEAVSEKISEPAAADRDEVQQEAAGSQDSDKGAVKPSNNGYRTPSGSQLMDDYYLFEEDEEAPKKHTHSSISISSNVSGIAKQDGFIYQMAPSHASSATGRSVGAVVEELSESSYSIPLSFGIQFRYPLAPKFSLGAGVNYTYLQRSFSALVNKTKYDNVTSQLHYVGLTASAFYNFIEGDRLTVYGRVGGAVDKSVSARFVFGGQALAQDASGVQWSVNAGVGLEYKIAKPFSIFIDPSASYYFDCAQPKSIRTEQPLMFSLEGGVRFSF